MADFDYESNAVGKYSMPPSPHSAGVLHVHKGEAYVDNLLADNDMIGLCMLPKGCVPVDFTLYSTDLDTSNAIVMDVGIAATARSDLIASTTFIAATSVGKAGGIDKPDAGDLLLRTAKAKNVDRIIAAKVTTVATAKLAGYIRGEIIFRAAENDEWSSYPSSIASYPLV
jgi:hypothetical protein